MTETTIAAATIPPSANLIVEEEGDVVATPFLTLTLADLRFFAICYLAGLIFFLVMLS